MTMAITVKFLGATNTSPARMRAFSPLTKKGVTVHYPSVCNFDTTSCRECAEYCAQVYLDKLNNEDEHFRKNPLKVGDVFETYDGNRVVTIKF